MKFHMQLKRPGETEAASLVFDDDPSITQYELIVITKDSRKSVGFIQKEDIRRLAKAT